MKNILHIYTDGSCINNPGVGGWSFVIIDPQDGKGKVLLTQSGSEKNTTNNRMELEAVIRALDKVEYDQDLVIFSDSQYVVLGITAWINSWRNKDFKGVKNVDLWNRLDTLVSQHIASISWEWVRGHNGNKFNELADTLARVAAQSPEGEIKNV